MNNNFVITTDYTADLSEEFYAKSGIDRAILPFNIKGGDYDIKNNAISYHDFYQALRDGNFATTSQVSQYDAKEIFTKHLKEGKDVIHFCFSSGVSSSFYNFPPTIEELKEEFPDRKVVVIDTLAGAGALGIMVDHANKMRENGADFDAVVKHFEENKLKYYHYFIVSDLKFLKRSGRISGIEATLGVILGIKPVLSLDHAGKIKPVAKQKGMKKACQAMCTNLLDKLDRENSDYIIIGHGDNIEQAHKLGEMIKQELDIEIVYNNVSHLIGAHAGPDCLALFFLGKEIR